ncbi:low-density lipoprotein receptor class A domain-containing protein 1 isoform X1 [Bufo bufo]|uniref:low-density lipoprotein receptor class A domain-containing protein 1 isoform X1 n=2 Tax=Bufo bufo TaxID=8384 RepID=UPI001ABE2DA4|nr:low-density lipoprotein receptor class A domain-containing protein 1 isoform X1 [Bufo bufo]
MNRTFPQRRSMDASSYGSTVSMLSRDEKDACCGCSRKCMCVISVTLLLLMIIAAAIVCAVVLAIPARTPESRYCVTSDNHTGFLCDDRITCLLPSQVCNSASDCGNGEDETTSLCSNLPDNLPGYLIFRCGNPQIWIYSNLKCNGINDCGDCSDESQALASCSSCPSNWWPCTPVLYQYCNCIPTSLCRNGVQDCVSWSDEYICP